MKTKPAYRRRLPLMEPLQSRLLLSAAPMVTQTNLVTDGGPNSPAAANTDPSLINPWGLTIGTDNDLWVSNNNSGTTTLYNAGGGSAGLPAISIPLPPGQTGPAGPTGVISNTAGTGFDVTENGHTAPSNFVFVTEQGIVAGWSDSVDLSKAITAVDDSASGAVFKGATTAPGLTGGRDLFIADFGRDKIVVLNSSFKNVPHGGLFVDPSIPKGFAPFNIQRLDGDIYVTYAEQDAEKANDVPGKGNGFVDVYSDGGTLLRRLASGGVLNSPWGLAVAPPTFGSFAGDILVGNFGNGRINAFSTTGISEGKVLNSSGTPLIISDLWSLTSGTPSVGGADTLYFTAGADNQNGGVLGTLTADQISSDPSTPGPINGY
ncbi:MAG: TIGR03118 family protein [Tepidisphaeraceae bacterium]|jgi:uncharacterized protein (TIGR03118 family)